MQEAIITYKNEQTFTLFVVPLNQRLEERVILPMKQREREKLIQNYVEIFQQFGVGDSIIIVSPYYPHMYIDNRRVACVDLVAMRDKRILEYLHQVNFGRERLIKNGSLPEETWGVPYERTSRM